VIATFDIPLVGPRGGKIPISLNSMKPNPHGGTPAWAIYKRCKDYYFKKVPLCTEYGMERAVQEIQRHVQYIRLIPSGGRIMDKTNFAGGLKPLEDILTHHGWIYDDDPVNVKSYYNQRKDNPPIEIHTIRINIGANLDEEYKFRGKMEDAQW
jgi:hypothetical protein